MVTFLGRLTYIMVKIWNGTEQVQILSILSTVLVICLFGASFWRGKQNWVRHGPWTKTPENLLEEISCIKIDLVQDKECRPGTEHSTWKQKIPCLSKLCCSLIVDGGASPFNCVWSQTLESLFMIMQTTDMVSTEPMILQRSSVPGS